MVIATSLSPIMSNRNYFKLFDIIFVLYDIIIATKNVVCSI